MKKTSLAFILALTAGASSAVPPEPIQRAIQSGEIKLIKEFKATEHLNGFVIKNGGQFDMVFSTPDGVLVVGDLINSQGESLREQLANEHYPKKDFPVLYKEISSIDPSRIAIEGNPKSKPFAYIYVDMNCGYCKVLHKAIDPYLKKHTDLAVAWVPVGFLNPTSAIKAAFVIDSKDKGKAIEQMMGGSPPSDYKPSPKALAAIEANRTMMNNMAYGGTPSGLYLDESGKALDFQGMVPLSELARMMGETKIANTDPQLMQFDQ